MHNSHPTQENQSTFFTKGMLLLVLIVIPLAFGILSLILGKDTNWDLKNYHYYNAYAFLEHRLDFDIAPAQLQSFINPLADLPFYWLTKNFPAWVAGFVLGFVHGYNLSLAFLIFWRTTHYFHKPLKLLFGICLIAVSAIAPGFISELGNTMHNNLTSLFVLGAVLLLIIASEKLHPGERNKGFSLIGIAGAIIGIGVGLKPSIAIFAVSSILAFGIIQETWQSRFMSFLIYGIAGVAGMLTSAGFWWWELWVRFGNPLFPFYNHIFKSPYFTVHPVVWSTFLPSGVWEYVFWPFIFSLDGQRVNQLPYRDVRFALLYLLSIIWLIIYFTRKVLQDNNVDKSAEKKLFQKRPGNYLLLFFLCSYIFWIKESSTYRFMIPLELLVPICFLIIVERMARSTKLKATLLIIAILVTFVSWEPFNWGRVNWGTSYFSVDVSRFDPSENAIVVMLGTAPMSYIIPHFPPTYRFVRPEGNIIEWGMDTNFLSDVRALLNEHEGAIYILYSSYGQNFELNAKLAQWKLSTDAASCQPLKINIPDNLVMCQGFRFSGNTIEPQN